MGAVAVLTITLPFPERENKAPLTVTWDDFTSFSEKRFVQFFLYSLHNPTDGSGFNLFFFNAKAKDLASTQWPSTLERYYSIFNVYDRNAEDAIYIYIYIFFFF